MKKVVNGKLIAVLIIIILGIIAGIFAYRTNTSNQEANSTRVVTDALGRQVTIPTHPKRVVILNSSNVDLYYHAGGAKYIVGKPTTKALSTEVSEGLSQVKEIGQINRLNVEAILALKPDLIIGIDVPFHQQIVNEFKDSNIPIIINKLDNFQDVIDSLKLYGELADNEQQANKTIETIKKQYDEEVQRAKEVKLQGRKVLVLWGTPDSMNMASSTSFIGGLLRDIGVDNIADKVSKGQPFIPLSIEYVAQENPQDIFVVTHGNPEQVKVTVEKMMEKNPVWHNLPAVKAKHVFILPADLFGINPGTRISQSMSILIQDLVAGK